MVSDPYGPNISTGLGNHQHTDHGDAVCQQHYREVETKAEDNGKPHIFKEKILMLPGAAKEQDNDQQTQKGKGNIPVNSPGEGGIRADPAILGEETEDNSEIGRAHV